MHEEKYNLEVKSENDLIELVQSINTDIEFQNLIKSNGEKQQTLDMEYLLKRYRTIKRREEIKRFRSEHDCMSCIYFSKPRKCVAIDECLLEQGEDDEAEVQTKVRCSKDEIGDCPYGNESGTCFGYCLQRIIKEHREKQKKAKERQNE